MPLSACCRISLLDLTGLRFYTDFADQPHDMIVELSVEGSATATATILAHVRGCVPGEIGEGKSCKVGVVSLRTVLS